jgi:hypothetical protein
MKREWESLLPNDSRDFKQQSEQGESINLVTAAGFKSESTDKWMYKS